MGTVSKRNWSTEKGLGVVMKEMSKRMVDDLTRSSPHSFYVPVQLGKGRVDGLPTESLRFGEDPYVTQGADEDQTSTDSPP